MTGLSRLVLLVVGLLGFEVFAQNATLSLDDVDSQVSDFLQLIQNGSVSTRGTSSRSLLPSGCALAVRLILKFVTTDLEG
jgi:hypothetical protein